jgi:hypothetical protein
MELGAIHRDIAEFWERNELSDTPSLVRNRAGEISDCVSLTVRRPVIEIQITPLSKVRSVCFPDAC